MPTEAKQTELMIINMLFTPNHGTQLTPFSLHSHQPHHISNDTIDLPSKLTHIE